MLSGFKKFIIRGNAVDLAIGVVIGAAFGTVVNSLVTDIFTPFISSITKTPDFSGLYFLIRGTKITYGNFLNNLISFFIVASSVYFFVVTPMNKLLDKVKKKEKKEITKKTCEHCMSEIHIKAQKCAFCGSNL